MKSKSLTVDNASIQIETSESGLAKITVHDGYFSGRKWTFYVPPSTRNSFGFVPPEVIKFRMLHDFNVKLGHYSTTLWE